MSVSRSDPSQDETAEHELARSASLHAAQAPTDQLLTGPIGDQCANCGAVLAGDQRYCLNCGERRGRSRFAAGSAPMPTGPVATTTTVTTTAPPPMRRGSAGATLIAGIATLILAMGVGVLIGQNNASSNTQTRAAAPQVIVNGGGSGAGTTAASTGNANPSGSAKHPKTVTVLKTEKAKAANAAKAAKPTAAAIQKAGNAAAKVTGGSNAQKPTVQAGDQCAAGSPGCTNGHFTGTFFGGP